MSIEGVCAHAQHLKSEYDSLSVGVRGVSPSVMNKMVKEEKKKKIKGDATRSHARHGYLVKEGSTHKGCVRGFAYCLKPCTVSVS